MSIQLKKGVLDLVVLSRIARKDSYGYDIYHEINKVLGISESTIYPILRKMVHEGLLDTYLQESPDGPARKYFKITLKGKKRLDRLDEAWKDFIDSVEQLMMR